MFTYDLGTKRANPKLRRKQAEIHRGVAENAEIPPRSLRLCGEGGLAREIAQLASNGARAGRTGTLATLRRCV